MATGNLPRSRLSERSSSDKSE